MRRTVCCLALLVSFVATSSGEAQTPVPSHKPAASPAPAKPTAAGSSKPQPVALVNGVPLLADRLQAAMNELMPYGAYHAGIGQERVAKLRKDALEKIVDEELQFQEAKRLGLVASKAEVDREYARVRRRYETEQAFVAALQKAGITKAVVRAEAARRALITAANERVVKSRCAVTDAEALEYFEKNQSKFVMPEARHVYTLTLGVEPSASRQQWDAVKKQAGDLLARLRAGADFEALAREYSTDPNKDKGGDLGYVHRGRLSEEFEAAIGDAKAGSLLGPVQTIYGFHLLRIADIRPASQRTFPEVRERLLQELSDKKCAEVRDAWLRDLRGRAKIVIPEPTAQTSGTGVPVPHAK